MYSKLSGIFLTLCATLSPSAFALSNSANVPVFLYHSAGIANPCDYASHAGNAMSADLERFYQRGITVVPLYWIAEWATGLRDGSTLPEKVVGITFDDGVDIDWSDLYIPGHDCQLDSSGHLESMASKLRAFKSAHPDLPWYSPHAVSFVVASPVARSTLAPGYAHDTWWADAQNSGIMEVYNHSADHDHETITSQTWDYWLQIYVPVGGYVDGVWKGAGTFDRIGQNYVSSNYEVTKAATYIRNVTGVWPDLFAYPQGNATPGLQSYFANYGSEHGTLAAFDTSGTYVTRGSNRWALGRFIHGFHFASPAAMDAILTNAGY